MQEVLLEEKSLTDVYRKKSSLKDQEIVDLFNDENLDNFLLKYNTIKTSLTVDLKEKSIITVMHNFFMETTSAAFGFKNSVEILDTVNAVLKNKTYSSFIHYFCLVYPVFRRNESTYKLYILMKNTIEYRKKNDIRENDLIQSFIDLMNKGHYDLEEIVQEILNVFVDNLIHSY
ncbi:hypothetical protein NQ314_020584 [Rhamnusium bicolor]|uniref:Uncharacterized protein n=1 Tax=Rhamnusium bicolor TaxID=1586634 RepID=A0AAV8WLB2_9CUCU|nr:hypothetical protein NQ314_020584 [Rhamnusium bicolor]